MNLHRAIAPEPSQRRGACPTLREPMQTGDGLLARLRPAGGVLSPSQLQSLAGLAQQFGNGQIEITARGNLQVRGLTPQAVAPFAQAVEAIVPIDTGVPVEVSPLAGHDPQEIADPRPIAASIRQAIAASGLAFAPKLTVIVDGGGAITLAALRADVRLIAQNAHWAIAVGAQTLGLVPPAQAADAVMIVLRAIAALGPDARARDLDLAQLRPHLAPFIAAPAETPPPLAPPTWPHPLRDGTLAARIGLTFGAATAATMATLAAEAQAMGIAQFALAPDHGLVAICPTPAIAAKLLSSATTLGFVVRPDDPRRAISACIGSDGCASGALAARRVAEALAQGQPDFFDGSFSLHVSGCAKGCAHPAPALLTLVGSERGPGLVVEGSAAREPALVMAADRLPAAMQHLGALWRQNRGLGESVGSCFKRLGAAAIIAAVRQG